jgi:hypothetical protein
MAGVRGRYIAQVIEELAASESVLRVESLGPVGNREITINVESRHGDSPAIVEVTDDIRRYIPARPRVRRVSCVWPLLIAAGVVVVVGYFAQDLRERALDIIRTLLPWR